MLLALHVLHTPGVGLLLLCDRLGLALKHALLKAIATVAAVPARASRDVESVGRRPVLAHGVLIHVEEVALLLLVLLALLALLFLRLLVLARFLYCV